MPLATYRCSNCKTENSWANNFCGTCGQDSRNTKKAIEAALAKYKQVVQATPTSSLLLSNPSPPARQQAAPAIPNVPVRQQATPAVPNSSTTEPFRWKEALLTGACFVAAFVIFSAGISNTRDTASAFLVFVLSAGLGFSAFLALIVTSFWTKVDSLDPLLKLVAYVPVVAGGIASFVVVAVVYIVIMTAISATKSYFSDMERQSRETSAYSERELEELLKKYR
jgi:hypothetical protein